MTPSNLTIRPATPDDSGLLLSLVRELAEYEQLAHEVRATETGFREAFFGARPLAEALVAVLDGEPVGMAIYFANFSTFLAQGGIYLEDIFVRPHVRGRGIGRALLARVARVARERGCGKLEWSVLNWNEPALAFYRKLGAVPRDRWTTYRLAGDALERLSDEDY